jgi:hypothetical protein
MCQIFPKPSCPVFASLNENNRLHKYSFTKYKLLLPFLHFSFKKREKKKRENVVFSKGITQIFFNQN